MRYLIAFLLFIQSFISFSQNENTEDCYLNGKKLEVENIAKIQSLIDSVHEFAIDGNERINCIEYLLQHFPESPELHYYYAVYARPFDYDTTVIENLKKCINMRFKENECSLYIGLSYLEYFKRQENVLSLESNLKLLKSSTNYLQNALSEDFPYPYYYIGQVQQYKRELNKETYILHDYSDTLKIVANIWSDDSNSESIIIIKTDESYKAIYQMDSIFRYTNSTDYSLHMQSHGYIKEVDINQIVMFEKDLFYYENPNYISTAPDHVSFVNGDKVISKKIHDYPWKYLKLRKELFGF